MNGIVDTEFTVVHPPIMSLGHSQDLVVESWTGFEEINELVHELPSLWKVVCDSHWGGIE